MPILSDDAIGIITRRELGVLDRDPSTIAVSIKRRLNHAVAFQTGDHDLDPDGYARQVLVTIGPDHDCAIVTVLLADRGRTLRFELCQRWAA